MESRKRCWNHRWTTVWLILAFLAVLSRSQRAKFDLGSQPSDLAVSSSRQVFVATGSQLLRLEGNLALRENVTVDDDVLNIAASSDGGRLVACLSDRSCAVYNANNLEDGPELRRTGATAAIESTPASSVPVSLFTESSGSFYTGSYGELENGNVHVSLNQYGFRDRNFTRSSGTNRYGVPSTIAQEFTREFITGFIKGSNAYYFVVDAQMSLAPAVRVLRVCHMDECAGGTEECEVTALYEAELRCGNSVESSLCGVFVLESYGDSSETTVLVTRCNSGRSDANRICSYTLSAVDSVIDDQFDDCSNGIGSNDVVWDFPRQCSVWRNTAQNNCTFNFALDAMSVIGIQHINFRNVLVNFDNGDQADEITASLALNVASNTLLFVAYTTNNGNHFLTTYHVTDSTATIFTTFQDGRFYDEQMSGPVTQLEWAEGLDCIYATTDSSVLQIPIEECSNFTDCEGCVGYGHPLCGWCTVEQKCSRMSQCQNASETMRWVQGSNQCISVSISPSQFVEEDPEILNVTVTPGLPPLLLGESFDCYFADSEGQASPIRVEAVVVTNTTYTCNITGSLPSFSGVQLVTDFSFISSDVEVPFGTNESAVTLYNCPAAERCSECVETNNACGWCILYSTCSGTPLVCANDTNWIRVDETGNFTEVCPLLEPSSSSSGDYVHPVVVDRDLELRTRNLPEPIGEFLYQCQLGSLTLNAVFNGSITCLVSEDQIILPSGASGSESVDVVWVNTVENIQYTIDTLTRAQVNVVLYDCSQLAVGCSQCIVARNMNEFDCGWCSDGDTCFVEEQCSAVNMFATISSGCPSPTISSFSPTSGPLEGGTTITIRGTDLGATLEEVMMGGVMVGSTPCDVQEEGYIPGEQIVCETTVFPMTTPGNVIVLLQRESGPGTGVSSDTFSIVSPTTSEVDPEFGPVSGGTAVTVRGTFLDSGNIEDTRITLVGENETDCRIEDLSSDVTANEINCTTSASMDGISSVSVVVYIDNAVVNSSSVNFMFRNDPNFTAVDPMRTIPAGGIQLRFSGQYLDVVQQPVFVVTDGRYTSTPQDCSVISEQLIECITPRLDGRPTRSENLEYTIEVDDAPGPNSNSESLTLAVVPNPSFGENGTALDPENAEYLENSDNIIRIRGQNLDSVDLEEIRVEVGGEQCIVQSVSTDQSPQILFCEPPQTAPGGNTEAAVVVFVGTELTFFAGTLTYISPSSSSDGISLLIILIIVVPVAVVLFVSLLVICIIVCVYRSKAHEKDKRLTNLLSQMELWELEMADECKRAFTELQTDLADLVQISSDKNLPYRDFRSFAMRFLFPSADEGHPVLLPLLLPEGRNKDEVLRDLRGFQQLIMDKKFLLLFVRTLEAQGGQFSLQDKCNVASLLMVCFQNDLDYATDILQTLLSELMRRTVTKSHPKLLLRRTESVAEKMLANWLSFLLFPYLLEHAGEPLFILYRAIKQQLEKGPVDIITGEARHSLSEEKLLRQHLDVKVVEGVVETESGEEIPIKLLDCDSITQAKEKLLDVLYRNAPASKRPQLTDVDLELRRHNAGIPLRDQDQTNLKDGDWLKVNTLGHYRLAEMSQAHVENPKNPMPKFKLVRRPERPVSGMSFDMLGTIIANMGAQRGSVLTSSEFPHVYHLVQPETGDMEDGGPRQGQKILTEVFLTRLLSTKRIIQPYVDDLFHAIFAVPRGRPLPKAIKSLFDFLDLQAAELGIQDPEILHTWKTNSLPLRFWVNLIKNPDFVFDIHKSATVDACLTIIAQAYIDACSTAELKYTKDTPSARLLYVNEVKQYKTEVQQYYSTIQSLPKLDPYEMQEYLRDTAKTRQLYFVTESALYELFKFASHYSVDIEEALNEEGLTSLAARFSELTSSLKV